MTQQNLRVKNPSVTLYAFHLCSELATEEVTDADLMWENLIKLSNIFSMPELQQLREKLICYQDGKYNSAGEQGQRTDYLELIPERELRFVAQDDLTLSGSVYPLRIHDAYAVDFTFSFQNQEVAVNHLRRFNPQSCLMPNHIQASLGQTLLLYAKPLDDAVADKNFADECVKALLHDAKPPSLSNQGQLFGSPIFEYEIIPKLDALYPLTHILVWLGKYAKTLELAGNANFELINLLNCRHKVLFAYHQARQSNDSARKIYNALDGESQKLHKLPETPEERLKELEILLNKTSDNTFEYARHLRNLDAHRTTIQANTINYAKWLGHIRDMSLPTDDLTFLDDFHAKICQHHLQQIDVYLDYLKPGHHLFEQMTTTILGLLHIGEQKQQMIRAEKFEFLITFIGAAVGTGAISATAIPDPSHLIALISHFFDLIRLPLIDSISHFFDWIQLPLFELPKLLNNFALPEDILKVMFHLIVGGTTSLVFTPLISVISKRRFTGK